MREGRTSGQSLAELALLLPVLLLILMGCLDLGRAFAAWVSLTNGTREGARYAAAYPVENDNAVALTRQYIVDDGWAAGDLTVDVSPKASEVSEGCTMTVTASLRFHLTTMVLFGGGPITVSARTQMQSLAAEPAG